MKKLNIACFLLAVLTFNVEWTHGSAGLQALPADNLVDMLGVNTHLGDLDTVYWTEFSSIIVPQMTALGVRHARDGLNTNSSVNTNFGTLNAAGISFSFISSPLTFSTVTAALAAAQPVAPYAFAWEGPNEIDNTGMPTFYNGEGFPAGAIAWATDMWNAFKTDPTVGTKPIIINSMANGANFSVFCSATSCPFADADYGNIHSYSGATFPALHLDMNISQVQIATGTKSIYSTELGWHTDTIKGGFPGVSEAAQGKYISTMPFEYFSRGLKGAFDYELIDLFPDPDDTNIEDHFGLLRNDGTEKPGFTTLQNIIALLGDPGSSYASKKINVTFSGGTVCPTQCSGVHVSVLDKRNGRVYIALWQEILVYNTTTGMDISITPINITATFGDAWTTANIYEPYVSSSPLSTVSNPKSVVIPVPGDTMIIELIP